MNKDYYLIKMKQALANTPKSIVEETTRRRKLEDRLWECVERGDFDAFNEIAAQVPTVIWRRRFYGDNCERELSVLNESELYDIFSIFVALCSRHAVAGGATPIEVFTLGDMIRNDFKNNKTHKNMQELSYICTYSMIELVNKNKRESSAFVCKVKGYIEANVYKKLTVSEIASALNFNYDTLSARFSKETGEPLKRYVLKEKYKEAKRLLESTDMTLSAISEELCFSSQSHFQRAFKDIVGATPNEYRKSVR